MRSTALSRPAAFVRKAWNDAVGGRLRLLVLLLLFDFLLIAAVILSMQKAELIEEKSLRIATRQVYERQIRERLVTTTKTITLILPYGSLPSECR